MFAKSKWKEKSTSPVHIFVPSVLIVSFAILLHFVGFDQIRNMAGHKKEGRLSPTDPNSYARPGNCDTNFPVASIVTVVSTVQVPVLVLEPLLTE